MEKIEKVYRDTGKKCFCKKGNIVEIFTVKFGKNNGIIGPGSHTPSWVASIGFSCEKCGLKYGEPAFTATKPTKQTEFELTLSVGRLKKKITADDIVPTVDFITDKEVKVEVGGVFLRGNTLKRNENKTAVPKELEKKPVGTKVFILPRSDWFVPTNGHQIIQLSEKIGSPMFSIKNHCIE